MGKGSKPRPVNKAKYDKNYQDINWKSKKK